MSFHTAWVISDRAIPRQWRPMSAMPPIATVALVEMLAPDLAAPLWQAAQAQATAILGRV
jgi:hypothetical protein